MGGRSARFQPHQHSADAVSDGGVRVGLSEVDVVIRAAYLLERRPDRREDESDGGGPGGPAGTAGVQAMHLNPFEAIIEQLNCVPPRGRALLEMER